jgi:hypothetical protein
MLVAKAFARRNEEAGVPREDIAAQGYDLSLNRYKEVEHEEVEHGPPLEILTELNGGTPSRAEPRYSEGHIPWITGADIARPLGERA